MPKVVHFEVGAHDIGRASAFYRDAFDWQTQGWEGPSEYTFLVTGDSERLGIDGAVFPQRPHSPRVVLTLEVESLSDSEERVKRAGGKVVRPGQPIPGVGTLAYVEDTEGNLFGVLQRESASG